MPDEFRFAIDPVVTERNAKRLVDILAQSFSSDGARCEDLRREFERITSLKRQMFYDTLAYCKFRRWVTGGGKGVPYRLNEDGSWKPILTSAGEILEKDRLEYLVDSQTQQIQGLQSELEQLRDWSNGSDTNGANVALSSLMKIVGDSAASTRQRIKASAAVLGYKTEGDASEFARKYLQSVCESTDIAYDYWIEAGELLRKHEAPRIVSETIKPTYREAEPAEKPEPLMQLVARRKERQERRELEAIERLQREANPLERGMLLALLESRQRNGNGSDDSSA